MSSYERNSAILRSMSSVNSLNLGNRRSCLFAFLIGSLSEGRRILPSRERFSGDDIHGVSYEAAEVSLCFLTSGLLIDMEAPVSRAPFSGVESSSS